MSNFLKKVWIFLVTLTLAGVPAAQASQTFLYLLYDGSRAGEKNQVLGVGRALKEYLPENTERKEFDLKDEKAFLSDIQENVDTKPENKGVVVAAGEGSIEVLKQLKLQPNRVVSYSSHQYTPKHTQLKGIADIVALPKPVVTPEILEAMQGSHTTILQTVGVPHNLSPEVVQKAYQDNKGAFPVAEKYIGVILGGDAETPDNKVLYYTAAEAQQMAGYLVPQVKLEKAHLLILNGPRTGKHNPKTGEFIKTSHRDGNIDAVTGAFVEELQSQGLARGQDFTLLDFQFDKPSAYPVVLGALCATKSPIFVAGESTSMVSETADCLSPGLATAYTNGAMNENHHQHCKSEQAAGRVNILENHQGEWTLLKAAVVDPQDRRSASQLIAQEISEHLQKKPLP